MTDLGRPFGQPALLASLPEPLSGVSAHTGDGQAQDAVLLEIIGHLGAAKMQLLPSDDQIIAEHIRSAHGLARLLRRLGQ